MSFRDLQCNRIPELSECGILSALRTRATLVIGTTSPQHLLHIAGTIGTQDVIVSGMGADYVFDPDYHLMPFSEVGELFKNIIICLVFLTPKQCN
jgi:hypothetical protein